MDEGVVLGRTLYIVANALLDMADEGSGLDLNSLQDVVPMKVVGKQLHKCRYIKNN